MVIVEELEVRTSLRPAAVEEAPSPIPLFAVKDNTPESDTDESFTEEPSQEEELDSEEAPVQEVGSPENIGEEVVEEKIENLEDTEEAPAQGLGSPENTTTEETVEEKETEDELISAVRAYLEDENYTYIVKTPDEETTLFCTHLTGKQASFRTIIDVKPNLHRVLVLVEAPVKVAASRRAMGAEYLMRVNYSLAVGSFEMDFRDGEVRNRNSLELNDGTMTREMLQSLVMIPAATMDRYFNGLMEVVYGGRPTQEAYEEARNPGLTTNGSSGSDTSPGAAQLMQLLAGLGRE